MLLRNARGELPCRSTCPANVDGRERWDAITKWCYIQPIHPAPPSLAGRQYNLAKQNTNLDVKFEMYADRRRAGIDITCRVMGSFERAGGAHEAECWVPGTSAKSDQRGSAKRRIDGNECYLGRTAYTNSARWKRRDDAGPLVQRC